MKDKDVNGTKTALQSKTILSAIAGLVVISANAVLGTHFGATDQTTILNGLTDVIAAVMFVVGIVGRFNATKAIGYVATDPVTAADIGKEVAQAIGEYLQVKQTGVQTSAADPTSNG